MAFLMSPRGEDIGVEAMGNSVTFWNLTMTRGKTCHLFSFYQEQNLLLSPQLNQLEADLILIINFL